MTYEEDKGYEKEFHIKRLSNEYKGGDKEDFEMRLRSHDLTTLKNLKWVWTTDYKHSPKTTEILILLFSIAKFISVILLTLSFFFFIQYNLTHEELHLVNTIKLGILGGGLVVIWISAPLELVKHTHELIETEVDKKKGVII